MVNRQRWNCATLGHAEGHFASNDWPKTSASVFMNGQNAHASGFATLPACRVLPLSCRHARYIALVSPASFSLFRRPVYQGYQQCEVV